MRVWIDMGNPPQTRYLLPIARRFEARGFDVLLSARDYGATFTILRSEGTPFLPIGGHSGRGKLRNVAGVLRRRSELIRTLARFERPDLLVTGARSATLAARRLRIPTFVISDYEYADLLTYRLAGSFIVHPDVIDEKTLLQRGVRREKMIPFSGLKEDFTFADVDLADTPPMAFESSVRRTVRVLFRPPAEESHYYRDESGRLSKQLLRYLAQHDARVVFSPRDRSQMRYLDEVGAWAHEPIRLKEPVQFVSLLKGVDLVVSAGGTMLREAAFLGIPAHSVFQGRIGAVDRHLASIGRLTLLTSPGDFERIRLVRRSGLSPLRDGNVALDEVVDLILKRVAV